MNEAIRTQLKEAGLYTEGTASDHDAMKFVNDYLVGLTPEYIATNLSAVTDEAIRIYLANQKNDKIWDELNAFTATLKDGKTPLTEINEETISKMQNYVDTVKTLDPDILNRFGLDGTESVEEQFNILTNGVVDTQEELDALDGKLNELNEKRITIDIDTSSLDTLNAKTITAISNLQSLKNATGGWAGLDPNNNYSGGGTFGGYRVGPNGITNGGATRWMGGEVLRRAVGGGIPGLGAIGSDSVHTVLTPGEYVHRKSSVEKFGKNFMDAVNIGDTSRVAGIVMSKLQSGGSRTFNTQSTDNRKRVSNRFNIFNRNSNATRGTYNSLANKIAMRS